MRRRCSTCGSLADVEHGFYRIGFPEDDRPLPAAFGSLVEVASDISGGRGHTLYRCPDCGRWYDYELDYEFIIPGTEDSETLRRITQAEASELQRKLEGRA